MSRLRRACRFIVPVMAFTIASWGFLFALLLTVSLFHPLALGEAFRSWVLPWSIGVGGAFAAFALAAQRRMRQLESQTRGNDCGRSRNP
jgi:hypothetical protein